MKKQLSIFIILAILLTAVFGFGGAAIAAGETLDVSSTVTELLEGGSVEFKAVITAGDTDLTGYLISVGGTTVYDSDGATLVSGEPKEVSFTYDVTTEQLGTPIEFALASGGSTIATDTVTINKKELVIDIGITPSVSPSTLADAGDTITLSFAIENLGEADIDDLVVTIPEFASSDLPGGALNAGFTLAPTQSHTVKYRHTMGAAMTLHPVVTYTSGGVEQPAEALEPIELKLTDRDVNPVLTVDNENPQPGEEVTFTLTITNEGNVSYTDMKVTWDGTEMEFPSSRLRAGETKEETYKLSFTASTNVKFNVSLKDHTGDRVNVDSNEVRIELPVDSEVLQEKLLMSVKVDRPQLTSPSEINFSGYVTNTSDYTLSNVTVTDAIIGTVLDAATMAPGEKINIKKAVNIDETTTYTFILTAYDRNSKEYTKQSEPITVTVNSTVAPPTATEPPADITMDTTEDSSTDGEEGGGTNFSIGYLIALAVLGVLTVAVGIALLVVWRKGKSRGKTTAVTSGKKRPAAKRKPAAKKPSSYRDRNNF